MLTIIILASIAVIALFIGFFEIQIPFINKKHAVSKEKKQVANEPSKSIEAFYRTIRVESWLSSIQNRRESNSAASDSYGKTALAN